VEHGLGTASQKCMDRQRTVYLMGHCVWRFKALTLGITKRLAVLTWMAGPSACRVFHRSVLLLSKIDSCVQGCLMGCVPWLTKTPI